MHKEIQASILLGWAYQSATFASRQEAAAWLLEQISHATAGGIRIRSPRICTIIIMDKRDRRMRRRRRC